MFKNFLLLILLIASCSPHKSKDFKLLEPNKMAEVMEEAQIIEAKLKYYPIGDSFYMYSKSFYDSLFYKYEIDKEIFDSNLRYYSNHPKLMQQILDKMIEHLSIKNDSMNLK